MQDQVQVYVITGAHKAPLSCINGLIILGKINLLEVSSTYRYYPFMIGILRDACLVYVRKTLLCFYHNKS